MTLFHAQTKYCAIWISCQKMQPQPASFQGTTRKNICTNTDNYFKCYWTSFLLMPFASRYSSTRQLEGKTKIWLNEFFGWCRYCANIFFITSSYRCFCFILGLFLSLATLLHTLQVVVGVDWCRIGCLWKEEKMSSKSLQFLIHLSKHCNWIVNKKTSRFSINLDRASTQQLQEQEGKNPLYD